MKNLFCGVISIRIIYPLLAVIYYFGFYIINSFAEKYEWELGLKSILNGLLVGGSLYLVQLSEKKWGLKEKRINEHLGILFFIALILVPILYQIISYDFEK